MSAMNDETHHYGLWNIQKFSAEWNMSEYEVAKQSREAVQCCLQDMDECEALVEMCEDDSSATRKFLRRIQAEDSEEVIPRLQELCQNFEVDYGQYMADPEAWKQAHYKMDFEQYWDMMFRAVSIANQGFVEY